MSTALRFEGVTKQYGRGVRALDALTFEIPVGCIAGFVGHNGAGKTTAFSVVSGYVKPSAGAVDILGTGPFDAHVLKGRLGVLPQDASLPERHTPRELLDHLGRLQGLGAKRSRAEAERVLALVALAERADDRIGTLSHGMRRRVAVASALCGSPELVLLDEPLAGLDPRQAHGLRDALAQLRGGQTLVVSSHNLAELERLCDWVVMLSGGRCTQQGTLSHVTGQSELVRWVLSGPPPLEALSARVPAHTFSVEQGVLLQRTAPGSDIDAACLAVMEVLVGASIAVREVSRGIPLERTFLDSD